MKRIAVIAIAATTFAVGLNVGRYVESVKTAPVINVTVNGVSTEKESNIDVTCNVNDYYRNQLPYNFSFDITKEKLTSLKDGSTIRGMIVLDARHFSTETMLFIKDEKAGGGMVIAHCGY